MNRKTIRLLQEILLPITIPLSWLYRVLIFIDRHTKRATKLDSHLVVSVGNLTVGGTGKTPFVSFLGDWIEKDRHGSRITVLSRGYRAALSSVGAQVQLDSEASQVGDEPLWLKTTHPNWNILIGSDRVSTYQKYSGNEESIVILDDGFQHHKIKRDLDIVLIDSMDLLGNQFLLPAGPLREDKSAIKRADKVVFTKYREDYHEKCERLSEELIKHNPDLDFYKSFMICKGLKLVSKTHKKIESIEYLIKNKILPFRDKKIFAFCGIGNPGSFRSWFENPQDPLYCPNMTFQEFPDHYGYPAQVKMDIIKRRDEFDFFITTEKDATKWNHDGMELDKLYSISIGIRLETFESSKTPTLQSFLNL
jgi:tetraacyldisaccharide 4'-kinase